MTDQTIKEMTELEEIRTRLTEAERRAEEYLAGWKRARADYQNREKEMDREHEAFVRFAMDRLLFDLLPVLDQATRALAAAPPLNGSEAEWIVGIRHVFEGFRALLRSQGVEEAPVLGERFDPERHEAVGSRKEEGKEAGLVLEEVRACYTLHGRVLRAAQVIISE